jgi:hypothetical protein
MNNGQNKKPRASRVVRLDLPPGALERAITGLQRGDVLLRIGVCVAAAAMMWLVTGAGARPFPFRLGDTPDRDIVARVAFFTPDPIKTQQQRDLARTQTRTVYKNTGELITAIRDELKNKVAVLARDCSNNCRASTPAIKVNCGSTGRVNRAATPRSWRSATC